MQSRIKWSLAEAAMKCLLCYPALRTNEEGEDDGALIRAYGVGEEVPSYREISFRCVKNGVLRW